jgi:hypothetical protein
MESKLDMQFLVNLAVPVPLILKGVVAAANLMICSKATVCVTCPLPYAHVYKWKIVALGCLAKGLSFQNRLKDSADLWEVFIN